MADENIIEINNNDYIVEIEDVQYEISVDTLVGQDYEHLYNRPKINSVELIGNKTSSDLSLASAESLLLKEDAANKVTSINSSSTDTQYASAKCVYDNLAAKADISDLATVATSGNYDDLSNKPTIPAAQVNSDWNASIGVSQILNKPSLSAVATSGSYNDLTNKPTIPTDTGDLTNGAGFITASSIPAVNNSTVTIQKNGTDIESFTLNQASNETINITVPTSVTDLSDANNYVLSSSLADVATSGSYSDLSNTPVIPAAQIQSDWNQTSSSALDYIKNKPAIPADTSDLTNGAGFITNSALSGYATETWVSNQGYITGITSSDVTTALGYTPYNSSNPNGYTSNTGTVTSVNNVSPVNGNVTLSIPNEVTETTVTNWGFTKNEGTVTSVNNVSPVNGNVTLSIPAAQVQSNWNETDTSSKAYIQNKPTIPAAQVNSDWNSSSGLSQILNKPTLAQVATSGAYADLTGAPSLATVATSGSYNDLNNKPTIPTVNNATLTITQGGVSKGTFTANADTNVTIALDAGGTTEQIARNIGEIVQSTIPLTDAGLHLLDGALISGSGSYADFVDYIADIYDASSNYFCTESDWQTSVTNYGVCGKFVYDSVNNTVRLPKITGFVEGASGVATLGDLTEAGLPNITGSLQLGDLSNAMAVSRNAVGALGQGNNITSKYTTGGSTSTDKFGFDIDASRSSSIYGNSNTVQPQSVKVLYYIVIATSTKTAIAVDIDEIATDLNGKADVDLSNLTQLGILNIAKKALGSIHYDANDFTKIGALWYTHNLTSGTVYLPPNGTWLTFEYRYDASNSASSIGSAFSLGIRAGGSAYTTSGSYPHYYFYAIRIEE